MHLRGVDEREDALGGEELVVVECGHRRGERGRVGLALRGGDGVAGAGEGVLGLLDGTGLEDAAVRVELLDVAVRGVRSARVSAMRSFWAATAPCTAKPVPTMAPMAATAPAAMSGPRRQPVGWLSVATRGRGGSGAAGWTCSEVEEGWFCMTFTGRNPEA